MVWALENTIWPGGTGTRGGGKENESERDESGREEAQAVSQVLLSHALWSCPLFTPLRWAKRGRMCRAWETHALELAFDHEIW